jgi:biotin carboxyl carrier protein
MRYTIEHDGALVPVDVAHLGAGRYQVKIDDGPALIVDAQVDGDLVHLLANQASHSVTLGATSSGQHAHLAGAQTQIQVLDSRTARRRAQERDGGLGGGANIVRSPMPGRVVKILVGQGDAVTAGQGIAIIEAMKMENELRAEIDGTVETVHVQADDRVEGNATLVTLTPQGD